MTYKEIHSALLWLFFFQEKKNNSALKTFAFQAGALIFKSSQLNIYMMLHKLGIKIYIMNRKSSTIFSGNKILIDISQLYKYNINQM